MANAELPGRLGSVEMDGELPRRAVLGPIFDELDYQMATQAYLWALPLVSYAQWHRVHRDVFERRQTLIWSATSATKMARPDYG